MNLDTLIIDVYVHKDKFFSFETAEEREDYFEPMIRSVEIQILALVKKLKKDFPELEIEVE